MNQIRRFILLFLGAKNYEPVPSMLHLQVEMYLAKELFPKLAKSFNMRYK